MGSSRWVGNRRPCITQVCGNRAKLG
ncbi:MAG: hypothetical protein RLZZ406_681, partial [Pseudomonadota bacterium]